MKEHLLYDGRSSAAYEDARDLWRHAVVSRLLASWIIKPKIKVKQHGYYLSRLQRTGYLDISRPVRTPNGISFLVQFEHSHMRVFLRELEPDIQAELIPLLFRTLPRKRGDVPNKQLPSTAHKEKA